MLSPPTSALAAGAQSLVVTLLLLLLGYLLVNAASGGRGDPVVYAGLAFPALCVYVLLLSLIHIATGGGIFSHPWLVRLSTAALGGAAIAVILRRRRSPLPVPKAALALALILLLVGFIAWCGPLFRTFPLGRGGDTRLHLGWAMEMMNGETTPSSPLTGEVPNYYPWFFHSLLAFMANLMPGGRSFHALSGLQFLHIGGAVLSLFALGRELTKRYLGAATAATFGALSGGIGYLVAREPALLANVRATPNRYLGDLFLKRSYNSSFNNLTPALPRDIAFALIPAFLFLLILGVRDARRSVLVGAGTVAGIVGLTGAEGFFFCVLVVFVVVGSLPRGQWIGRLVPVVLPMMGIWAVWLIPMVFSYLRLGGFVNTSSTLVDLPLVAILGGWGLITPFAAFGLVRAIALFRSDMGARVALLTAASAFVLVVAATLGGALGPGFETLGRVHRYWPLVHLSLVPLAAIGAVAAADLIPESRRRTGSWVMAAALLILSIPSPILGSIEVKKFLRSDDEVSVAIRGRESAALNLIDPSPGGETCVAAVPDELIHPVFSYTGYREVRYKWTGKIPKNFARIRWADMKRFIPWDAEREADNQILVQGSGTAEAWDSTAEKYAVDHVVTTKEAAFEGTFGDAEATPAGDYMVLSRTDCGS